MMSLTDLPLELLYKIVQYLPSQEIFWNVGFTCVSLHDVAMEITDSIQLDMFPKVYECHKGHQVNSVGFCLACSSSRSYKVRLRLEQVLKDFKLCRRINYAVVGKCYGSIYEKDILGEVQENRELCDAYDELGLPTKV